LGSDRLDFFHIAASEAPLFAETGKKMTERAREMGPNPYKIKLQSLSDEQPKASNEKGLAADNSS